MKINKKDLTICFMTFTGTLFLLWLFLILSASIPNAKIQDNMVKSALVYAQEDAFSYCDGDKMNGIADNYADSIWLNVAWFMGKGIFCEGGFFFAEDNGTEKSSLHP